MKNIFLVFIVLVLAVMPVFTQTSVGMKAALSDYSWRGDDWNDYADSNNYNNEFSPGFGFGAFVEILLSNHYALQPEVIFTSAKHKYGDGSYWIEQTWHILEMLLYKESVSAKNNTINNKEESLFTFSVKTFIRFTFILNLSHKDTRLYLISFIILTFL